MVLKQQNNILENELKDIEKRLGGLQENYNMMQYEKDAEAREFDKLLLDLKQAKMDLAITEEH